MTTGDKNDNYQYYKKDFRGGHMLPPKVGIRSAFSISCSFLKIKAWEVEYFRRARERFVDNSFVTS